MNQLPVTVDLLASHCQKFSTYNLAQKYKKMEALSGVSRIIRCNIIQFNHLQFRAKIVLQDRPLRTGGRKSSILHMGRLNVLIQWNKNSRGGFLRVNWKRPAVRRCTVEKQGQKRQNEKHFSSSLNRVCCRLGSKFEF